MDPLDYVNCKLHDNETWYEYTFGFGSFQIVEKVG